MDGSQGDKLPSFHGFGKETKIPGRIDIKEVEDLQCDESGDKSEIEESTENVANQRELSGKLASVTT